jgi:hypothetical protein
MIKGLKIAMIIWAAIAILVGLAYIFLPSQLAAMGGFEKAPAWTDYVLALLGVCFISASAFVIVAAVRGPLKNLMWVQFSIVMTVLIAIVAACAIMRGLVTFEQEGPLLIVNAVFAVVFLALYPWRAKSGGK